MYHPYCSFNKTIQVVGDAQSAYFISKIIFTKIASIIKQDKFKNPLGT
jgi:hypothetical protein